MKYLAESEWGVPLLELTRRNLEALLEKLDDPLSRQTLIDPDHQIAVRAVPDEEHYKNRPAGAVYMPTRGEFL